MDRVGNMYRMLDRVDRVGNMYRMLDRVLQMQRNFWPTPRHFHLLEHQYTVAHLLFRALHSRIRSPTKRVCVKKCRGVVTRIAHLQVQMHFCSDEATSLLLHHNWQVCLVFWSLQVRIRPATKRVPVCWSFWWRWETVVVGHVGVLDRSSWLVIDTLWNRNILTKKITDTLGSFSLLSRKRAHTVQKGGRGHVLWYLGSLGRWGSGHTLLREYMTSHTTYPLQLTTVRTYTLNTP